MTNVKNNSQTLASHNDKTLIRLYQMGSKAAGSEFLSRHVDDIQAIAKRELVKVRYDLDPSADLDGDCLSVATQATLDALKNFDFESSNIMSFIRTKVYWAYKTLQRENAMHSQNNIAMSRIAYGDNEDGEVSYSDVIESKLSHQAAANDNYAIAKQEARQLMVKALKDHPIVQNCVNLYIKAIDEKVPCPDVHVAKLMGVSRQTVHTYLRSAPQLMGKKAAHEVLDNLRDDTNVSYAE